MTRAAPRSLHGLLTRFHFGITLFAVALSGLTILFAGVTALRGYADRNLELVAHLGSYALEPALVFNDPVAANAALEPLRQVPGIARLTVLDDRGRALADWKRPQDDPSPAITRLFFPAPYDVAIQRNGSTIGTFRVWGDSTALAAYLKLGLVAGLACLAITAIGTIAIARRFEYELVKPLGEIASVAHEVRRNRKLDRRVQPLAIVELDRLGRDVNALLDELDGWHGQMASEKEQLAHQAMHDGLTGLGNREAFDARLDQQLATARRAGDSFALLFIDCDHFKQVNDRHGHVAGDAVLVQIAARLRSVLRDGDFAARLGGDEFGVILSLGTQPEHGLAIITRILNKVEAPVEWGEDAVLQPRISIGRAQFPTDGRSAADLLAAADASMYAHKSARRAQGE